MNGNSDPFLDYKAQKRSYSTLDSRDEQETQTGSKRQKTGQVTEQDNDIRKSGKFYQGEGYSSQQKVTQEFEVDQKPVNTKTGGKKDFFTNVTFDSLNINSLTKKAIKEICKYEYLTKVQDQTLQKALDGHDMIAQAKTGTGKTSAFLVPAIQKLIALQKEGKAGLGRNNPGVGVIIVSPTRELANQIAKEANWLNEFHEFKTCTLVGGVPKYLDAQRLEQGVDLIVSTPGRLIDHLENTPGFAKKCGNIKVFILDEADQMLEMGFQPDLRKIIGFLNTDRQTLMFTATVQKSLLDVANIAVKTDYLYINTIPVDELHTHKKVPQQVLVVPIEDTVHVIFQQLREEMKRNPSSFKIMIFFTTVRYTALMAELCRSAKLPCIEMHSKKSQEYRTRNAKTFVNSNKQIMFTSDVSARGVDYPDVTLILQVGITEREQYIHRLGRTGRACGVEGRGLLLLNLPEANYVQSILKGLPVEKVTYRRLDENDEIRRIVATALARVKSNTEMHTAAEDCYKAFIGFHNGYVNKMGWSKQNLCDAAKKFAQMINVCDNNGDTPRLGSMLVQKMGLSGCGLNTGGGGGYGDRY